VESGDAVRGMIREGKGKEKRYFVLKNGS